MATYWLPRTMTCLAMAPLALAISAAEPKAQNALDMSVAPRPGYRPSSPSKLFRTTLT